MVVLRLIGVWVVAFCLGMGTFFLAEAAGASADVALALDLVIAFVASFGLSSVVLSMDD